MEYTVMELARLSGVSPRTLRYYDSIGLLAPARVEANGYRVYGGAQVDLLQQILFYRELGIELGEIGSILYSPDFDTDAALQSHLAALKNKKERLNMLIANVERSIAAGKGECNMTDREKFEGFKREAVEQNEKKYGAEARARYGAETVDAANAKFLGLTEAEYSDTASLEEAYKKALAAAAAAGDPASDEAQRACALHGKWLQSVWPEGLFSQESHRSLVEGYALDERFTAYYEKLYPGCAEFFAKAIGVYYEKRG